MTDLIATIGQTPPRKPAGFGSAEAKARLAQRRRADTRFRAYGLAAILLAIAFLAVIVLDIVVKAIPAFTQSTLRLDVPVSSELVRSDAPKTGDYDGLIKVAMRGLFPNVKARTEKKAVDSLLSSGAADDLRQRVVSDPTLIGQKLSIEALLSSDADLYARGITADAHSTPGTGSITPSDTTGTITLEMTPEAVAAATAGMTKTPDGSVSLTSDSASLLAIVNDGVVKFTSITAGKAEGEVLAALSNSEPAPAGTWRTVQITTPETSRKITDKRAAFVELLKDNGAIETSLNLAFFTGGDSREPELAGILGALAGTAYTMLVTLGLCLPIGVAAAIYLEEFAPRNRISDLIEVNINNLAAVPSIVFGLLGLAVFLNGFGLPRGSPLVGGLVLALLVLPTIIIAGRAALKAVPPSIREAAIGVGATRQQAIFHHVLPVAMPGILTGAIIGMAHALGETAPLLMIGMIAFIADVPSGPTDAATVLPVQIFLWSDLPEAGFQSKTAAAILVLLGFLILMNGVAIWLRKKFERRW